MVTGIDKALAGADNEEEGFVFFKFKHWFWERAKPKAKKETSMKIGCRMMIHPETMFPWILLFDTVEDANLELKKGEYSEQGLITDFDNAGVSKGTG